ncbi:hypothetical protein OROGR_006852 [Orobanche gracilis]
MLLGKSSDCPVKYGIVVGSLFFLFVDSTLPPSKLKLRRMSGKSSAGIRFPECQEPGELDEDNTCMK